MNPSHKLEKCPDGAPIDKGRYQRLVGRLIYLFHTRSDIAFTVSTLSQFKHSPCEAYLEVVYQILKYLKGTAGMGQFFKKNSKRSIDAFTNADWVGAIDDKKSTSGYCTCVWGNLVTWRSKKQSAVSRSRAETEFRTVA
ncbi:hypothetical protein PanWU01x14_092690 [Parasponia andersonii]|uniref:Mitochondrial protein n=1 Tax=Parasponia andersonii TaxID=3476 RepID=A0A2P5D6M4_PARAD|nr:hypothetical protein PanWU01x14_092690 [Parasponia andersonii]